MDPETGEVAAEGVLFVAPGLFGDGARKADDPEGGVSGALVTWSPLLCPRCWAGAASRG